MIHLPYIEDVAEFTHTKDPAKCSLPSQVLCTNGVCCTRRDFARGSKIYLAGEIPAGAYLIKTGAVGLQTNGQPPLSVETLGPDDLVGLSESIGKHPFLLNAVALRPTTTTFIKREELARLIRTSPPAAKTMLDMIAKRASSTLKIAKQLKVQHRQAARTKR